MTEPTIAYTLFALLLASSACLLIGTVIGWYAQSYQNRGLLEENETKLRDNQLEMAALRIQENGGETIHKLSTINDQKTALIRKLMEKQLQLQKDRQQQAKKLQSLLQQIKKQRTAMQIWRDKASKVSEDNKSKENKQLATKHVEAEAAQALKASDSIATTEKTGVPKKATVEKTKTATPSKPVAAIASISAPKPAPTPKGNKKSVAKGGKVKDDLTRIKGIGPTIEVALNEVGITNVKQLAELTPIRVNELDKELGRYGRISRMNWVGLAKKVVAKQEKVAAAAA